MASTQKKKKDTSKHSKSKVTSTNNTGEQTHANTCNVLTRAGPSVLFMASTKNITKHTFRNIQKQPSAIKRMIKRNPLTNASKTHDSLHSIIPKTLHESVLMKGTTKKSVPAVPQDSSSGIADILGAAALLQIGNNEQKD